MQLHLVRLQTFSAELLAAKEADMPTFEEAFDTESLKKFFQNQDSVLNTPFTCYTDTPPTFDDFSNLSDTQDIFGGKIQNKLKSYTEESFPISLAFNPDLDREVSGMPNFFKNDSYKVDKNDFAPHTTYQMMNNMSQQKSTLEEAKKSNLTNGQFTINFAKNAALANQNKSVKIVSALPTMEDYLENNSFGISQDVTSLRINNKKPVFIIERLPRANAIAKVEKKKIINPIIKKKNDEKKADKKDKKASENVEKSTEGSIDEEVDNKESKKSQNILSATKSSSKKDKTPKTN